MPSLPAPDPRRFRYVGGDPSLDLVNTVDWTPDGLADERLVDYPALLSWAEGAGLIQPAEAARLRRKAAARTVEAGRVHAEGLRLRELIRSTSLGVVRGAPQPVELEQLNRVVAQALDHRRLETAPRLRRQVALRWEWVDQAEALDAPLWRVAIASAALLTSPDAERIRVCQGPACGWMYVDRSRNGLRRWCAMDMCGGREKARRHYARIRAAREVADDAVGRRRSGKAR